jgi:hypothetical protein
MGEGNLMPEKKNEIVKLVRKTKYNNEPVKICLNANCSLHGIEQPIEEFRRPCKSGGIRTFRTCNTCEKSDKKRGENSLRQEAAREEKARAAREVAKDKLEKIRWRPIYRSF